MPEANTNAINLDALKQPFVPEDVEWRLQESGKGKDGKVWAKCLCYVTNRAIMDRLDDVVGPGGWKNEYAAGPGGGIVCGISIKLDGEWVTKWDGADNTEIEPVKGGLSNAMKRAAVQWGIGRYLYDLEVGWAQVSDKGAHFARLPEKKGGDTFKWDPPTLPAWAVPGHYEPPAPKTPSTTPARFKQKDKSDVPHESPANTVSGASAALAAIENAHTIATLDRYAKAIEEKTNSGEYTADDFKTLEMVLTRRRAQLANGREPAHA